MKCIRMSIERCERETVLSMSWSVDDSRMTIYTSYTRVSTRKTWDVYILESPASTQIWSFANKHRTVCDNIQRNIDKICCLTSIKRKVVKIILTTLHAKSTESICEGVSDCVYDFTIKHFYLCE